MISEMMFCYTRRILLPRFDFCFFGWYVSMKICLLCRRRGHSLKNCPNKNDEVVDKKLCYNCGETSHSLANCPYPLQDGIFPLTLSGSISFLHSVNNVISFTSLLIFLGAYVSSGCELFTCPPRRNFNTGPLYFMYSVYQLCNMQYGSVKHWIIKAKLLN